jgi:hypothetical protein
MPIKCLTRTLCCIDLPHSPLQVGLFWRQIMGHFNLKINLAYPLNPELLHVDKNAGEFVLMHHSCRSASIGSILAARRAGK